MTSKIMRYAPWLLLAGILFSASAMAANLKPFILAKTTNGDLASVVNDTKTALQGQGFKVLGDYAPNPNATVIVVTDDALLAAAAKSDNGGFGAVERVSVTRVGNQIQVAYANPAYTAAAFRMQGNLADVSAKMAAALGAGQPFGSQDGLSASDLRDYHYMFAMPYFTDVDTIGTFASHAAAVATIEKNLAAGVGGAKMVYKIAIPGTNQTLFGVSLSKGDGADNAILSSIDDNPLKHTAYLPYELLVKGKKAIALPGKFYIAINWPDLGMGSFMGISGAPGSIRDTLKEVAGNNN